MIHVGDNSWNLRICITDLALERTMRVRGDQHLGSIMLQLVDPENPKDWSDHALYWPAKNIWLTRTRATLDQCGVQADSLLYFTPMHKILRVQLPDLRYLDCRVDYSVKTFAAVLNLCKQLDIRYAEELSLSKPLEAEHLKKNYAQLPHAKRVPIAEPDGTTYLQPALDTNSFVPINSSFNGGGSTGSLDKPSSPALFFCAPLSPHNAPNAKRSPTPTHGAWKVSQAGYATYDSSSSSLGDFQENLASSPRPLSAEMRAQLLRPKSLVEKARLNVGWLDSSLSLMEQGIREYDTLCLRFKYYTFFDLNPKYDQVRINQLYEQAKWSILNEELDCNEQETLMFAALQFQINHQLDMQPLLTAVDSGIETSSQENDDDDIDSALNELQLTLEGGDPHESINLTRIPELSDYLRFLKPQRFLLRGYKRYYFIYRDLHLLLYKNAEESRHSASPSIRVNLRGCEVTPDVNLAEGKYAIRLEVSPEDHHGPNSEVWVRCENEQQYAKWLAACRLAAKGRSLADSSYESEVDGILSLLQMQRPVHGVHVNIDPRTVDAVDYLSPKMLRKLSGKAVQRILEAHANVRDLPLLEAKMKYIQAWQSLPDFGVSLFVIKFDGHRKEELLGVTHNRIMRMDLSTGDHIKTWRYNTMKAWNVNWGIKCMMIQFHDENVVFSCHSADCKVVHEFIGGYIFMSMRSKDNNQTLNEELFHKLTGGWS
ncbi:unc-112-related protein [Drosophila sulfurigaster albostrigata]|uniref:unc-112-related protein n=1 Tax=Drosophila sulfurigaster albostrigata TaxID=89887 RepID=UPI002D2197A0|nr:unc-112-related protein [Drosophila sulfurigaster albostrigata]